MTGERARLPLALTLGGTVLGTLALYGTLGHAPWVNFRVHTTLEVAGAAIAVIVGAFLLFRGPGREEPAHHLWPSLALICMGILDLLHAVVQYGPAFYWSRTVASLAGGLLFLGAWLPDRFVKPSLVRVSPPLVAVMSLAGGAFFVLRPNALPPMIVGGAYVLPAKLLNLVGGVVFLGATASFWRRYRESQRDEDYLFTLHCLAFGLAGVLFAMSAVWDSMWWFFHVVRLVAYVLVITFVFQRQEQVVRAVESRLELAVQHARVGFYDWDVPRNRLVLSERMKSDWGLAADTNVETLQGAIDRIHPEDRDRVATLLDRAIAERTAYAADYRVVRPDGTVAWVDVAGSVTYDERGKPVRMFGTSLDITSRRQAEDILRLEHDKFAAVVQNTQVGVGLADTQGRTLLLNPAGLAIHGFSSEEEMFDHLPRYVGDFELAFPDGRTMPLEEWPLSRALRGEYVRNYDVRLRRKSTDATKILTYSVAPVVAKAGEPLFFVFSIEDISQRKQAQAELQRTTDILSAVMVSSSDIIYVKDRASRMRYCNPMTLKLAGATEAELYGKNDVEFLGPGNGGEEILATDERIMTSGVGETVEEWVTWSDGSRRLYMSRKEPHRDDRGEIVGLIGISRDITELKRAQEGLEEAVRARDNFVSIASHELNTPLTSLRLQLEMMTRSIRRGTVDPARMDRLASVADRQIERLARLVADMLDVARINSGRLAMQRAPTRLVPILEEAADRFRELASQSGTSIRVDCEGCDVTGDWDAFRLEQVVVNLLSNAVKYGEGKPIDVVARREDDRVVLRVTDRGIGIAPEHVARIFQRFERAVGHGISGLGLGLYIVRNIVEAHGGTVHVTSVPGEGSTFTVELPVTGRGD